VHNNRIARIGAGLGGASPRHFAHTPGFWRASPLLVGVCVPTRANGCAAGCRPAVALPKLETLGLSNNRLANLGVRARGARARALAHTCPRTRARARARTHARRSRTPPRTHRRLPPPPAHPSRQR
jgi:hypothetical protein